MHNAKWLKIVERNERLPKVAFKFHVFSEYWTKKFHFSPLKLLFDWIFSQYTVHFFFAFYVFLFFSPLKEKNSKTKILNKILIFFNGSLIDSSSGRICYQQGYPPLFSKPGQSQGLLYTQRHHLLNNIESSFVKIVLETLSFPNSWKFWITF